MSGQDSQVFREGDIVVKEYYPSRTEEQVRFYAETTNKASVAVEKAGIMAAFPYSGFEMPVQVIPFINLAMCQDCGTRMEGVAPYIPTPDLDEDSSQFDIKELKIVLKRLSWNLDAVLGVSGIDIVPRNVKNIDGTLVVTDLCADITELRRKLA